MWCWEHSSVLSGGPQMLSEVDVPHLCVFWPECEQFLWGWHGSVEESLSEKWPAGQRLHTVSLTGVPGRDKHRVVCEFHGWKRDFERIHAIKTIKVNISICESIYQSVFFSTWLIKSWRSDTHQLFSVCEHDLQHTLDVIKQTPRWCDSKNYDCNHTWLPIRARDDCVILRITCT